MAVQLNHTIVWVRDSHTSAAFLAEMLGLPAPQRWGPFEVVTTANGTNLDFMDAEGDIAPQHYAFLVDEAEFDEIFARIRARELAYWRIRLKSSRARSTATMAGAASTSRIRTDTCSRSSPDPTAAAAEIRERPDQRMRSRPIHNALTISSVIFLASPSSIMVLSR